MDDYMRIRRLEEADFDGIISAAGGQRATDAGASSSGANADYVLGNAAIELKFIEEEGLEKHERQKKIAGLFSRTQENAPVYVVDASLLNDAGKREYYRILERAIKARIAKASKQLARTAEELDCQSRVLLIVNNGYASLSQREFKQIVIKCVENNTLHIDVAIPTGIYYYSDTFDHQLTAEFDQRVLNVSRPFRGFDVLQESWSSFLRNYAKEAATQPQPLDEGRWPVVDLKFDVEGKTYVKPAPYLGASAFWPGGRRPRELKNAVTEIKAPSAKGAFVAFPKLSEEQWAKFRKALPAAYQLQPRYGDWLNWAREQDEKVSDETRILVPVAIAFDDCEEWCDLNLGGMVEFRDLSQYATHRFAEHASAIVCKEIEPEVVTPPSYYFLEVREIGRDVADDLCSLSFVSEFPGFEKDEIVFRNRRGCLGWGLAMGSAYAVKTGHTHVFYRIDQTYSS